MDFLKACEVNDINTVKMLIDDPNFKGLQLVA